MFLNENFSLVIIISIVPKKNFINDVVNEFRNYKKYYTIFYTCYRNKIEF